MTFADDLLPVAFDARGIAGSLGLRVHTVALLVTYYSGQHTGEEAIGDELTPLVEGDGYPPRVRQMKDEELALGNLQPGTLEVGPLTPEFSGGGVSDETLFGVLPTGATRYVVITGPLAPNGAKYEIIASRRDKPLRRVLRIANPTPYP